ncbi:hypothetical protein [Massilia horti]|uniref:Uncharacterized protein n=1 Tax=Massilia horti TaxID=2562153 RepID=A0A4Y9SQL4_9BURK|nr:hypothetical protein [Massilia horti]TFW27524.1 hypothetical protein E4O92_23760 [Massilia horti]
MRDEPGISIGAFVVELQLEPDRPAGMRALEPAEIARLRITKSIVAGRAAAILVPRVTMPAPELHVSRPDVVVMSRAGSHVE